MKIFQNKKIFNKLIVVLIFILVLSFCLPSTVEASTADKLLKPVIKLLLGIGDGAMDVVHKTIFEQEDSTVTVDLTSKWWEIFWTVVVGVVVAIVVGAVVVLASYAIAAAAAALAITSLTSISVGTVLMVSLGSGVVAASVFNANVFPDDLKLPIYRISPEEIFSNEIPLFDVDFFNPSEDIVKLTDTVGTTTKILTFLEEFSDKARELESFSEMVEEAKSYGFTSFEDTYSRMIYYSYTNSEILAQKKNELTRKYGAGEDTFIKKGFFDGENNPVLGDEIYTVYYWEDEEKAYCLIEYFYWYPMGNIQWDDEWETYVYTDPFGIWYKVDENFDPHQFEQNHCGISWNFCELEKGQTYVEYIIEYLMERYNTVSGNIYRRHRFESIRRSGNRRSSRNNRINSKIITINSIKLV